MTWAVLFLVAAIILIAAWAYHSATDKPEQEPLEEKTAMAWERFSANDDIDVKPPDVFDEARIKSDLAMLSATPGLLGKYIAQAQIRFTQARQIRILERWTEFYNAGESVIRARTELARAHSELQQVGIEGDVKLKEKDARMAELEAEIAESQLRAAEAKHKADELRKQKLDPPTLTKEQERVLRKSEIEGTIARLRSEKVQRLAAIDPSDEEESMRLENIYDDRIAREEEELRKVL